MEHTLREPIAYLRRKVECVLILVLVEYTLRETFIVSDLVSIGVLILVLVEHTLRVFDDITDKRDVTLS